MSAAAAAAAEAAAFRNTTKSLAQRRKPPVNATARADHYTALVLDNPEEVYSASVYFGDGKTAKRRSDLLESGKMSMAQLRLSMFYECIKSCPSRTGPMQFIVNRGSREWLQNCVFYEADAMCLESDSATASIQLKRNQPPITSSFGKLIVVMLSIRTHVCNLRNKCTLRSLLFNKPSGNNDAAAAAAQCYVMCPIAIVPSGIADMCTVDPHKGMTLRAPSETRLFVRQHQAASNSTEEESEQSLIEHRFYSDHYQQYLVSSSMSYINLLPVNVGSFADECTMRDIEPLSHSLDALHCLLGGMVRFHCERLACVSMQRRLQKMSSKTAAAAAAAAGLALEEVRVLEQCASNMYEAIYTPTVGHPEMSLRHLMQKTGFARLCRIVYFALTDKRCERLLMYTDLVQSEVLDVHRRAGAKRNSEGRTLKERMVAYEALDRELRVKLNQRILEATGDGKKTKYTLSSLDRPRAKWFSETLSYIVSFVIQCEHLPDSEMETLRFLQANQMTHYPTDDEMLNDTTHTRAADLTNGKIPLPFFTTTHLNGGGGGERQHRRRDCLIDAMRVRDLGDFGRQIVDFYGIDTMVWVFIIDFRIFCVAQNRSPDSFSRHEVIMAGGYVYVPWTALTKPNSDRSRGLADFVSTKPENQPWLADFFTTVICCDTKDSQHKMPKKMRLMLMDNFKPHNAINVIKVTRSLLFNCLPVSLNGYFLPNRPRFLRDFPLRGSRRDEFVAMYGEETASKSSATCDKDHGQPDLVTAFERNFGSNSTGGSAAAAAMNLEMGECDSHAAVWIGARGQCVEFDRFSLAATLRSQSADVLGHCARSQLLAPCVRYMLHRVHAEEQAFKHDARLDYTRQLMGHMPLLNGISEIVSYTKRNMAAPQDVNKASERLQDVRNSEVYYYNRYAKDAQYQQQRYAEVNNCSGSSSCRLIAKYPSSCLRCPFSELKQGKVTVEQANDMLNVATLQRTELSDDLVHYLRGGAADAAPEVACIKHAINALGVDRARMYSTARIHYPRDHLWICAESLHGSSSSNSDVDSSSSGEEEEEGAAAMRCTNAALFDW